MVKTTKKGKKAWIKIVAPREFKNITLGESYVYTPDQLIGKKLSVNLSIILGDMRKQNINMGFKIYEANQTQALTKTVSFELMPTHVKKMNRALKDKMDDSFVVVSKDNLKIKIKPLLLTRNKTSNSTLTSLRKKTREKLAKIASENDFSDFLNGVISSQLQKELRADLNKIYPLSVCEIRKIELVSN